MRRTTHRAALAAVALGTLLAGAATPAGAAGPSRATAARYAERTYVTEGGARRRFALDGGGQAVRAGDGSTLTAFPIGLADAGDGSGEAVLLFRGTRFLGWASDRLAIHVGLRHAGTAIKVRYGVYSGSDPFCCPHATRTIRYRWDGRRVVADGTPPLTYGRRGSRLHLAP